MSEMSGYQMGWVCPKCGRVYSPLTMECLHCGGEVTVVSNMGTYPDADAAGKELARIRDMWNAARGAEK